MIQVTQSPFLQALGHAIINSLWHFALLWLMYILVTSIVRLSSHGKFVAGLILQFTGFAWFVITLFFYFGQVANMQGITASDYAMQMAANTETNSFRDNLYFLFIKAEQFLPYLSIAYLALLVFLSVKWLQAFSYTNNIKANGLLKIDVNWRLFVQKIAGQMGIKKNVNIYLSSIVTSPLTIGFLKPVILIPIASINHLSTQQVEAVILHELAHIKRLDYLMNIILSIVESVLFFNPFMQLISRQIKRERENCCDDWVLQYEYNAATYAKALLKLATFHTRPPALALQATGDKHLLLKRVKRIIEKNERTFNYRHQLLALLMITGILSSMAWLTPQPASTSVKTKFENDVSQPILAKVDNPLFNPVFFLVKSIEKNNETIAEGLNSTKRIGVLNNIPSFIANTPLKQRDALTPKLEIGSEIKAKSIVASTEKLRLQIHDTTFKNEMNQFLSASFWKELDKTELQLKQVQLQLEKMKTHGELKLAPNSIIHEVEEGLALVRQTRQELQESTCKVKSNHEQEELKRQLREFTVHSINMKKVADDWNRQLIILNKQLVAATETGNIYTAEKLVEQDGNVTTTAKASQLINSKVVKLKATAVGNDNGENTYYIIDDNNDNGTLQITEPAKPAAPPAAMGIRITNNGKVIKIIKI